MRVPMRVPTRVLWPAGGTVVAVDDAEPKLIERRVASSARNPKQLNGMPAVPYR